MSGLGAEPKRTVRTVQSAFRLAANFDLTPSLPGGDQVFGDSGTEMLLRRGFSLTSCLALPMEPCREASPDVALRRGYQNVSECVLVFDEQTTKNAICRHVVQAL